MASHRIASDPWLILLLVRGVLSVGLDMLSGSYLVDPFAGWLLAVVLLLVGVTIAAMAGVAGLRPRWLVAASGAMVAYVPLIGLLPANRCLIFGSCVSRVME